MDHVYFQLSHSINVTDILKTGIAKWSGPELTTLLKEDKQLSTNFLITLLYDLSIIISLYFAWK